MSIRPRPLSMCLRQLLGGTALLLCMQPAFADDTPQSQDNTAAQTNAPATDSKADPNKAKLLDNITVTAQSRSQEMQSVPIPLQIVTAKQIDTLAATDISKMDMFVPGLVVGGDQPTQPRYQLRGISTGDFGVGTEPAVGVYIDGVYAARSGGAMLAFNDVQRIEVLKGPQGTLFGRNAAAGAISIVTNEPSDHLELKGRVRLGNEGKRYADALINLPINKDMALRVSALTNQSEGWIKDAATGKRYGKDDDWGTRTVFRWNFTDNTRMLLSWDHEKLNQAPQPAIGLISLSNDTNQRPPFPADPNTYLNPLHAPLYNDAVGAAETRTFNGVTLSFDHSFGWGSLVSTTAWRGFDTLNKGDYDGTNHIVSYLDTANIEHNNSWYQEFKLSGTTGIADWVGGVSYYQEQARQTSQTNIFTDSLDTMAMNLYHLDAPPLASIGEGLTALGLPVSLLGDPWHEAISNEGKFKAYAAFGDVIWHVTDRFNVTTGIRYTRDEKQFSWYNMPRSAPQYDATVAMLQQAGVIAMLPPEAQFALAQFSNNVIFTDAIGVPVQKKNTWNNVSPRLVLDYKFTDDVMGYFSVTKGYKAGGYNSVQVGSQFAPEKVINYEAGVKTVFPEQNLMLNSSVYYYRYDNKQSLTLDPNTAGSGVPRYLVNSTDQEAKGLEVEALWQPITGLRLNFTGAYIDATYRKAMADSGVDLTGQPTGEPKFSYTAGVGYTLQGVFGGAMEFDLNYGYRGPTRCNDDSRLQGTCVISPNFKVGESQQRTDARIDWRAPGDHWGIGLFANNLFNNRYVTGVNNISTTVFGTPFASVTPPRTWGVEFRAKL
ncbi:MULTISPECIES: TonB-dependent receptor [Dyella]|uniref:TonB-dependent receptor n=2 Tax=Dyella TaxID=231454 RepID=A0A4R0YII3_9GAMM|nr:MULTISPECIES: TonB-dependent receptor [Dyella]TBR36659.1 TonB-dependent receptor [Dyella terrae]TCI08250.1 TonB-dependent receptor [Dyella soli]